MPQRSRPAAAHVRHTIATSSVTSTRSLHGSSADTAAANTNPQGSFRTLAFVHAPAPLLPAARAGTESDALIYVADW